VKFEVVEIAFQHEQNQPPHISSKNAGGIDGISYSCRRLKMPRESYFVQKLCKEVKVYFPRPGPRSHKCPAVSNVFQWLNGARAFQ
jgi:hypothetical protein